MQHEFYLDAWHTKNTDQREMSDFTGESGEEMIACIEATIAKMAIQCLCGETWIVSWRSEVFTRRAQNAPNPAYIPQLLGTAAVAMGTAGVLV